MQVAPVSRKRKTEKTTQTGLAFRLAFLLYPCTLIGYVRIFLLIVAIVALRAQGQDWELWQGQSLSAMNADRDAFLRLAAVIFLAISSLLDAVDGYLARRFSQVTVFGACFDQLIDLAIQTVLWVYSGFFLAIPFLLAEWFAGGLVLKKAVSCAPEWKHRVQFPNNRFVVSYFAGQQRNPLSLVANVSHTVFPMALILGGDWPWLRWLAWLTFPGMLVFMLATGFIIVALMGYGARSKSGE